MLFLIETSYTMNNDKNLPSGVMDNALKVTEVSENGQLFNIIDYFLSDTIEEKSDYYDFLRAVNAASQYDEIHIHINNYGGDLDAAIQIYYSLVKSKARVIVSVEGACMSAATVIMLSADEIEFCPWSSIMIHAYSDGVIGKYQEIQSSSDFRKEWFIKFMNDIYGEFLTKKEISQIMGGKDLWMSSDDAIVRFNKIFKKREREYSRIRKENENTIKKINDIYSESIKHKTDDSD